VKKSPKLCLTRETLANLALVAARGGEDIYTLSPDLCVNTHLKPERVQ
jgi:hypothetical protein